MSTNGVIAPTQQEPEIAGAEVNGTARETRLCSFCQTLDLSIDKFVIQNGSSGKFGKARNQSSSGNHHMGSDFPLKSGSRLIKLGSFHDIIERMETGCRFCYLVVKSAGENLHDEYMRKTPFITPTCFMNWEIDGRDNHPNSGKRARTRRLHLHWDNNGIPDSYLVFLASKRLFEFNSDSQGSWEKDAFFLGRELKTNGNNQVLIKSWLDQCCDSHGPACVTKCSKEFSEMANQSYFGVIDVLDMCLKSLPRREGRSSRRDSSPRRSLSPYDKVERVRRAGRMGRMPTPPPRARNERPESFYSYEDIEMPIRPSQNDHETDDEYEPYVALSYVWGLTDNYTTRVSNIRVHQQQGGLETFLDQVPKVIRDSMDLVRRLGLRYLWVDSLCIVQDSKRSWSLNSRQMNLIYGNARLTICAADGSDAWTNLKALDSKDHSTTQHIAECGPGVRLMVSQLAETGINSSAWNTRAWTFQERLLSKRCLIFTEGRVFFQCRSATMSEDLVSESHGAGWSLDLAKSLPQILQELKNRPIRVYMSCMSRYSARSLTQPKDILAAFNGVSNSISDVMKAPFIFGLPSSHFDLALLWESLGSVTRRVQEQGEDYQGLSFPSWSWCGWKGAQMKYQNSFLEGVLINLDEWLTRHTWIAWYIRDGKGNLRPIWDGKKAQTCTSVEERWKGYKACSPHPDFTRLQKEALRKLGKPNEDDFKLWSKEQEETVRETKRREQLERKAHKDPYRAPYNHYGDDVYPRHYYVAREDRLLDLRPRDRSSSRGRDSNVGVSKDHDAKELLHDEYGRNLLPQHASRIRSGFQQCLPDNPFKVYIEPYTSHPDKDFPDQPLLQFWTWHASLRLIECEASTQLAVGTYTGHQKFSIADNAGDWCGSILLDDSWVSSEAKRGYKVDGSKHSFLAISDAKNFTKEECDVWTYYVPKERDSSEWDLYYVLLVEQRDRIWYRVGVGKVFKASFDNAVGSARWREIILG